MNDRGVRIERVRLLPDAGKPLEAGALYICAEPPEGIAQDVGCAFAFAQKEYGEQIHLINPERMLAHAVEAMPNEHPSTQTSIAGDAVAVSDQTSRLVIAANDRVEHEESDDLAIHTLLELHPLCEKRRAEGNPLEIACMLYFEKTVEPAKYAGADEAVLVGRLLADKISGLIEHA